MFGFGESKELRYQKHKDGLAEAKRICGAWREDRKRIDLEFRDPLDTLVLALQKHLELTNIPNDLGDKAWLKELLSDLANFQRALGLATADEVLPEIREKCRAVETARIFSLLGEALAGVKKGGLSERLWRDAVEELLPKAEIASEWFRGNISAERRMALESAREFVRKIDASRS